MLTKKDQEFYKKLATDTNDKKNKYRFCDMHKQSFDYAVKIGSMTKAKLHFEKLEFLMNSMKENERPEWYTMDSLENDRKLLGGKNND